MRIPATITRRRSAGRALVLHAVDPAVAPRVAAQQRQPASTDPRTRPYVRSASIAYCEQDGWYLHVPAGSSGLSDELVEPDEPDRGSASSLMPAAFASTSATRSRSQSQPRASAASGSPGRAIST